MLGDYNATYSKDEGDKSENAWMDERHPRMDQISNKCICQKTTV